MRECWIEHDRCAINCPCNEECPDGCPVANKNHPCDTWFCKGYVEKCAAEDSANREQCLGAYNEDDCRDRDDCCWVEYTGTQMYVPWCHKKMKVILEPHV